MNIGSRKSHRLDACKIKVRESDAFLLWMYNRLISRGVIDRTVGAPTNKERKVEVGSILLRSSENQDMQLESDIFALFQQYETDGLRDSDISWIKHLSHNDLFVCWYFIRKVEELNPSVGGLNSFPLVLGKNAIDSIHESSVLASCPYGGLGLYTEPLTRTDLVSCLMDFLFTWQASLEVKRGLLKRFQQLCSVARRENYLSFAKDFSANELSELWDYLRNKKNMIGSACDSLENHGYARVYAVFSIWPSPDFHKKSVAEQAKNSMRNKYAGSGGVKRTERANLTLSAEAKSKLRDLAGGERRMSAYVEEWILSQT